MEAEDVEAPPQRGEAAVGDALAAVVTQARLHEVELGAQLLDVRVVVGAEPLPHRRQPPPVRLLRVRLLRQVDVGHRGIRLDQRARHAPRHGERADVAPQQVAHERGPPLDRLAHRRRPDVRVPVAVAADPAAEPERRAGQPAAPGGEQIARRVPQRVLDEPQPLPDLVDDAGPVGAHLVRLPEDRHLLREPRDQALALDRGEPRIVELVEQSLEAPVLLQDRPRQRLGGVRRQHELDGDVRRGARDRVLADPRGGEQAERLVQRLAQRPALALDLAPPAHPVVLLGDVREVEVDREGAQDDGLRLDRERRDGRGQLGRRAAVAAAAEPGEPADPLLELEGLVALLLGEHAAERVAEQPHVRPEGGVDDVGLGAAHRRESRSRGRVRRRRRTASRRGRAPSRPRSRGRAAAPPSRGPRGGAR